MKPFLRASGVSLLALVLLAPAAGAVTFNSGSTGGNGAFPPVAVPDGTTAITLDLPTGVVTFLPDGTTATLPNTPPGGFADGVLNFTTVSVPTGVTLRFIPHAANTPVTILAQGDVTIDGTIDVSGSNGAVAGSVLGGTGGPGGFKGGNGQISRGVGYGGQGLGPGGGGGGGRVVSCGSDPPTGAGAGGGFGAAGSGVERAATPAGPAYGTLALLPLIGGSGGGGGTALVTGGAGGGGGGGGGAILIASSGTITVSGSILANGGGGGSQSGGGGSGGAVRLVATTIAGGGAIRTNGGAGGGGVVAPPCESWTGGYGGAGRVRLETYALTFPGVNATGVFSSGAPRQLFLANQPSVRVVSVNGVAVSATPIGAFGGVDIELPGPGTFPVVIAASRVPLNTTVSVTAKPETGAAVIGPLTSPGLSGDTADSSTATVSITFPSGGVYFIEARATFALP